MRFNKTVGVGAKKKEKKPPKFHEIRSFADALALSSSYDIEEVQEGMGHEDEKLTRMYTADHDLPFTDISIIFTEEILGGAFD